MDETTINAAKKRFGNSNKKSFAFDVLTLTGGTTLAQILTILSVPVLTRLYQPENFGVWALYSSITSIISVIICMRYEYAIMLPESDEDAINLLGVSFLAIGVVTGLTLAIIWFFRESIISILNSPQIGNYLWLVPLFVLVNGIFLALNGWNSRTKLFRRLSFSRISSSVSTIATQIIIGIFDKKSPTGLITGSVTGQSVATFILAGQIWRDDRSLIRKSLNWKKMYEVLKRYRKFPLVDSFSALMNSISWQLPAFLLAAFFSPAIVGFYSIGFRLLQMPMSLIGSSISQVFFQRASRAASSGNLSVLAENVFKILVIIGMFPILVLTIVGSDVFTVVFGKAWAEAGIYTQILGFWAFVWFISSPLTGIYLVVEEYDFGFRYNFINLATRFLSLIIGGFLGSARTALILFSISGIVVYGYMCLKMMSYSGVKISRTLKIVFSNFILFIPAGIILAVLEIRETNPILIVAFSGVLICFYYLYILKTDTNVKKIIREFDLEGKSLKISILGKVPKS